MYIHDIVHYMGTSTKDELDIHPSSQALILNGYNTPIVSYCTCDTSLLIAA